MGQNFYGLTNPQKNIWSIEQFYKNTNINNICGTVTIKQDVDLDLLNKAVNLFVKNNKSFGLNFKEKDGNLVQYFTEHKDIEFEKVKLKDYKEAHELAIKTSNHVFNINDKRLYNFILYKLENGYGGFVVITHHIISDAATLGLIGEVVENYANLLDGNNQYINKDYSYENYILDEKDYLASNKFLKDKEYWNNLFKTIPEIAEIPYSKQNSNNSSGKAERINYIINKDLLDKIADFCKENKISNYNFFMAIYAIYLSRVSNLNDFVIGTPILNRTNFNEKHAAGMFINTVALRININDNISFVKFVKQIAQSCFSMLRYQKYPYEELLKDLRKKQKDLPSLFDVMLSYQVTKANNRNIKLAYDIEWTPTSTISNGIYIHLHDNNDDGILNVSYDYQVEKYEKSDIENMHSRILHIIEQILENKDCTQKDIEIVTTKEKEQILHDFNNTNIDYPKDKTIVDLFEEQVEKAPDNTALVFENQQLTYRELNEKANRLANYLIDLKVKANDKIAILLPRCSELIISMLAIKKANCAYVLIEKSLPIERIKYMIEDAKISYVITNKELSNNEFPSLLLENIKFEELPKTLNNIKYNSEDYLSVVYTSGSTGIPKGILVKNNSINNLILGYSKSMQAHTFSNFLSICSVSFDMFAAEVWLPLLLGKKLILANDYEVLNSTSMSKLIEKHEVEFMLITPSRMNLLLNENSNKELKTLKAIQLGGEVLSPHFFNKLTHYTKSKIYNGYGPSETTSCATCKAVTSSKNINIGKPLPNIQVYICNKFGGLCPSNIVGEICIAGDGVSYGYVNQDELTKNNFIKNPFGNGLLYKTGDLAKFLPNGEIEFIGRNDYQVKIRGLRIELEEITKVVENFSNIEKSITLVKKINDIDNICCYFVGKKVNTQDLKRYINKNLPYYMVPSHLIKLEEFPLTINGKIDTKKLPEIKVENVYIKSETETEIKISSLWKKLFKLDKISVTSNFFDLGGDSLSAIELVAKIEKELNIKLKINDIFTHPTIRDLSSYISSLSKAEKNIIAPAKEMNFYPTSSAQKRIYYASSMDTDSVLYNISGGIIIDKILDTKLLQKCFQELVNRHEMLRTHFNVIKDDIVQIIDNEVNFSFSQENSSTNNLNEIYNNFVKPFDLSKAPLFRAKAVILNNKTLLLLDMHHIISDATSFNILLHELCNLYNGSTLPEKHIDYKDFCLWEKEQNKKENYKQIKDFWVNQYQNDVPLLNMPTTYTRPSVQSFEGANYYTEISNNMFENINKTAKKLKITPYMLMLSVYYILLSKYSSQDTIVVGTPVIGRELPELSNIVGMFVNTLALKNTVNNQNSFANFAKSIKEYCLSAFENQAYPFNELIKEINIKRDNSRNPLFDVMFIYQNNGYPDIDFNNAHTEYFIPTNNISKFDLSLEIIPVDNEFSLRFEYCTSLFSKDFIKKFALHYNNILCAILENSEIKIADIDMLSEEEKHQILSVFNNTNINYPRDKTIVDLFEEQVGKTPDNIALVFENKKLTYSELNEKANALARYLIENDVSNNSIVGIMLPRSLEMIISILAVLKTGSAYIPIDPNYPKNRIDYILKDSEVKLLLTKDTFEASKNTTIVDVSLYNTNIYKKYDGANLNIKISPEDLAYVIYTSGSTGNPKGVKLKHLSLSNLTNYCNNYVEYLKNNKYRAVVSITTVSFDIFIFETLISLQKGLKLVIANENEQNVPSHLDKLIKKENIEIIQTTPSRMQTFYSNINDMPHFNYLKFITLAGEQLPISLVKNLKSATNCTIYNGYGPSETTVFSTLTNVTNQDRITIGKPLSNTQIYIINKNNGLCPVGVPGEICISGDGVGYGYINKDELTKKSFIPNPFNAGSIMYKTGDLGYYEETGEIICLGRIDHQIKIRGLRIELDEIEKVILSFKEIEKAVVTTSTGSLNRQILCAYFVCKNRISISELKQYISMFLPNYMVPTYIAQIDNFAYTPNGKIDKKALPAPVFTNEKKYYKSPKTNTEYKILRIWENLLCISPISTTDNFFDIGGDSLLAIKMQMEILKQDINVSYSEIFRYNTIHKLAGFIDKKINIVEDEYPNLFDLYDYYNIDNLLKNNNTSNINNSYYNPIGNVLLTGVTGFLGAHILDYLIKNTNVKVYCLVRKDPSTSLVNKVLNKLHYYFGTVYDNLINKRIFIINSDLSQNNLGLTKNKLIKISDKISCVINSAAIVKHYGNYEDFEKINVTSVKKLINFCEKYNKKLVQISTLSVSGNTIFDLALNKQSLNSNTKFDETNLYIGQSLENVYVRSKFEAEKIILTEIYKKKLNGLILRIGNITNRSTDGKFQTNSSENAFANRLKAFLEIGALPDYIMDKDIEFSSVDCVAEAIIKSITHENKDISVLHIYNPNHVCLKDFINLLPPKYNLEVVSDKNFQDIINNMLKNNEKKYIISNILNDLNSENKLAYNNPINIKSEFSRHFLKTTGFSWPIITKKYIENLLKNI